MKDKILYLLKENEKNFVSGQSISEKLGVSRTSIWKYINILKDNGYEIESISKKGHRLISSPDILTFGEISENLTTNYIGKNIMYFQTLDSTNSKAKQMAEGAQNGTVVISEEQTSGRGRLGRSWISPKYKGIWMSIILKPDLDPMSIPKITQVGAASVIKAFQALGIEAYVKWPNDIVINGKKVCGILTEMSGELNLVNYVIMGIGINVNIDEDEFPEEIRMIATSISCELKRYIKRKELVVSLLDNFELLYEEFIKKGNISTSVNICRQNSSLIGKEIKVIARGKQTFGKALDLADDGELIVQFENGKVEKIFSGEVSIRSTNSSYTP